MPKKKEDLRDMGTPDETERMPQAPMPPKPMRKGKIQKGRPKGKK